MCTSALPRLCAMSSAVTANDIIARRQRLRQPICPVLIPCLAIPPQTHRSQSFHARRQRTRALARAHLQRNHLARSVARSLQPHLDRRRSRGNHKALRFAINLPIPRRAAPAAPGSCHPSYRRGQKARLPHILAGEIAQWLFQPKRKQRNHRDNRLVGMYAQAPGLPAESRAAAAALAAPPETMYMV
jgi:hypothetical protein